MKTMPIRDMLYEEPGPKTRRTITIVTILAVLLLLALLAIVIRQFVITGISIRCPGFQSQETPIWIIFSFCQKLLKR